jgi:hypothetical protein
MFHLELRQFPHVARAFNLGRQDLEARVLVPWVQGTAVKLDDRRWAPDRAKLTIYEGPRLASEEMGMGRGWANAARSGEQVTERLLAETDQGLRVPPALVELKEELLRRGAEQRLALSQVVELGGPAEPPSRASERLALAEQAVWELLHEGRVRLVRGQTTLEREEWQAALLSWSSWTDGGAAAAFVEVVAVPPASD